MKNNANQILRDEFERILEEIVFAAVEDVEEIDGDSELPSKAAVIRFEGPWQGSVNIYYPPGFGKHVAESMLGIDEGEIEPGDSDDAAQELLNVLTGNLLTALHGGEAVFHLHAPEVTPDEPFADGEGVQVYSVDGFLVGLKLVEKEGVAT